MQEVFSLQSRFRVCVIFPLLLLGLNFCVSESESLQQRSSRQSQPSPIQILANSLTEGGFSIRGKKVIVLTFYDRDDVSADPRLGELIAEKLTTELVKKGQFKILDRGIYGKILESRGLSLRGDVDMKTMQKIGQILDIDGIITGIIYKYGDGVFVNARLLNVDSGLILKAEEVFIVLSR